MAKINRVKPPPMAESWVEGVGPRSKIQFARFVKPSDQGRTRGRVMTANSRGVKRHNGNKSLPYKTYLRKGLFLNNDGFQCSLGQIKNRYSLSGLFREKTVKTLYEWISCLALTAPTKINSWDMRQTVPRQDLSVKYLKKHIVKWKITRIVPVP